MHHRLISPCNKLTLICSERINTAPLNAFPLPADPNAWSAQTVDLTVEEEAWFPVMVWSPARSLQYVCPACRRSSRWVGGGGEAGLSHSTHSLYSSHLGRACAAPLSRFVSASSKTLPWIPSQAGWFPNGSARAAPQWLLCFSGRRAHILSMRSVSQPARCLLPGAVTALLCASLLDCLHFLDFPLLLPS